MNRFGVEDYRSVRCVENVLSFLTGHDVFLDDEDGWSSNCLWGSGVPYLYRLRGRCKDDRFWFVFGTLMKECGMNCDFIFHDHHAGWRCPQTCKIGRYIKVKSNDVAIAWMMKRFYWGQKWSRPGSQNDNYYVVDAKNNIFIEFSHDGVFMCFSRNYAMLKRMVSVFNKHKLVARIGRS